MIYHARIYQILLSGHYRQCIRKCDLKTIIGAITEYQFADKLVKKCGESDLWQITRGSVR